MIDEQRFLKELHKLVAAYDKANPMRQADVHSTDCECLRCAFDMARGLTRCFPVKATEGKA